MRNIRATPRVLEDKSRQLPHHRSYAEDIPIAIVRLRTAASVSNIGNSIPHVPHARTCVRGRSRSHVRVPSRYRYVYYRERHRHSRPGSMTYRTRLVARTRSTAKQLFPAFPRLRRYVVAINNAIDDKLPLRGRVTQT